MSDDVETLAGGSTVGGTLPGADGPALLGKGATLGRYLVLDCLGMGGMGIVYAAYDPELDRKVAIKLVRPAASVGSVGGGRARLHREAQAMAKLSHPNVVTVHDVGTVDDQVFVAMEFIDGPSLRGWLEKARAWAEVVEVFRVAGRGLAAAHAQGLVHRDFKPDNVMIGSDGRIVVMDFGLVRALSRPDEVTDSRPPSAVPTEPQSVVEVSESALASGPPGPLDSMLTEVGSLLGTPAYMAPEQLWGAEADARSDQFSFCVALYEALYRERPFPGKSVMQLATSIVEGTVRPEPRGTSVPRWVRTVVLRGLAEQPRERFESMDELLAALGRDPSRRRRTRRAVAGVLIGGVVAALATSMLVERRTDRAIAACEVEGRAIDEVWNSASKAQLEASLVNTGSPYAAASFANMSTWLDPWVEEWAAGRTAICIGATVDESISPDVHARALACFDEQRQRLAAMLDVLASADTQMVAAATKAAAAFSQLESCADQRTLAQRPPLPASIAGAPELPEVRGLLARASALADAGNYVDAREVAGRGLELAVRLEFKPLEAEARLATASIDSEIGDYAVVHDELRTAYKLAIESGSDALAARAAVMLLRVLGYHLARPAEGLVWADVAESLLARLGREAGLDAAQLANNTALVYEVLGDYDESERLHRRALDLRSSLLSEDHPETGHSLANLGNLARLRGDNEGALVWHRRALEVRIQGLGPSHPDVARSHANLGRVHLARGELDEALQHFDDSYAILVHTLGAEHRVAARVLDSIGDVHRERGELDEALDHYRRALTIQLRLLGPQHPETAQSNLAIGLVAIEQGELELAFVHIEAAGEAFAKLGADHPSNGDAKAARARLCEVGWPAACA